MHTSDIDLLRQVAQRDRTAFEVLYRRYHRRLFGFVGRWLREPQTVEEVVDDVMFAVWANAASFEGRSRVSTWIFGIAHHRTRAAMRHREADPSLESSPEPAEEDPEFGAVIARDALVRALEELSPEQRAVVTLTFFEGFSYAEIATTLDCPVNTVKTRMFLARRLLRAALTRRDRGGSMVTTEGRHAN